MRGKHLTPEQRKRLLKIYIADGYEAAKMLAGEFGVGPEHISRLARKAGHYKAPTVSQIYKSRAAMWQRAKENGSVVA